MLVDLLGRGADQGVHRRSPAGSIHPAVSWFVPNMNLGALAGGVLLALFIYWGWDTAVSVNEETENKSDRAGHRGDPQHAGAGVHLRARHDRGAGLPRARATSATTPPTC